MQLSRIKQNIKSNNDALLYADTHFLLIVVNNILNLIKTTKHPEIKNSFVANYKKKYIKALEKY